MLDGAMKEIENLGAEIVDLKKENASILKSKYFSYILVI